MSSQCQMYLRLRHRVQVRPDQKVVLRDLCQFIVDPHLESTIGQIELVDLASKKEHIMIVDIMVIIRKIQELIPEMDVESYGPAQTIVEVVYPQKSPLLLLVFLVWVLLFIGSGLAIMNFHEDVSMLGVHQKIFKTITGESKEHPLLLQIPYSLGIGIGMILFFNHLFKKRLNEEPSPLEVEMFLYQQNLDQYAVMNENKEVQKKLNDST